MSDDDVVINDHKIWYCKIGWTPKACLPDYSDLPMRRAVQAAYKQVTGFDDEFIFSNWDGKLDESELAVVEHRDVRANPAHHSAWLRAKDAIEYATGAPADFSDWRTERACSALCELIFSRSAAGSEATEADPVRTDAVHVDEGDDW